MYTSQGTGLNGDSYSYDTMSRHGLLTVSDVGERVEPPFVGSLMPLADGNMSPPAWFDIRGKHADEAKESHSGMMSQSRTGPRRGDVM